MSNYKDPLIAEWQKVEKVILSCKTREQLRNAYNYYKLWNKRNSSWLNNSRNPSGSYVVGKVMGMFEAKLTCNESRTISNMEEQ